MSNRRALSGLCSLLWKRQDWSCRAWEADRAPGISEMLVTEGTEQDLTCWAGPPGTSASPPPVSTPGIRGESQAGSPKGARREESISSLTIVFYDYLFFSAIEYHVILS